MHIKVFCKVLRKNSNPLAYTAPWHIVGAQRYMLGYFLIANLLPWECRGDSQHTMGPEQSSKGPMCAQVEHWVNSTFAMY